MPQGVRRVAQLIPGTAGESMPSEKTADTRVFAGSINQSGALEIPAERIGRDTSYGKIIEAVERAERSRPPVQRLADRLAGYLVYFALGAAALTYLITRDVVSTISVIIVAGACGIAAGTPLAILGGIDRCARLGVPGRRPTSSGKHDRGDRLFLLVKSANGVPRGCAAWKWQFASFLFL
jgi:hypothetical protein